MIGFGSEVAGALSVMRRERKRYKNYLPEEAISVGNAMAEKVQHLWADVRRSIVGLVEKEIPHDSPYAAVWWYSVLLGMEKDSSVMFRFLHFLRRHRDAFSLNTQCFLYYQLVSMTFRFPELNNDKNKAELWHFYKEMLDGFWDALPGSLKGAFQEKRDKNLVLVVTEQFIGIQHGPTKTALDRCKILAEKMGKEVLLINSKEMMNIEGKIPFYGMSIGNHDLSKEKQEVQY